MERRIAGLFTGITMILMLFALSCQNQGENDKKGKEEKSERKPPEFVYDNMGNIIQRKDFTYDMDNNVRSKNQYDYKFDERNNRIEEITQSWDFTGKKIVHTIARFKYDKFNLKSEAVFQSFDPEGREILWVKNVYGYDSNGFEIRDEQFSKDGKPISLVTRKRDEKGRILEETSTLYHPDGSIKQHNGAQYDINGKILKSW